MNIARPATGFLIEEPSHFLPYLKGFLRQWPRVLAHWEDVKQRLKMTAHKEGEPLGQNPLHRVFEAAGSITGRFPTIRVLYSVFADTLTFLAIAVESPQS